MSENEITFTDGSSVSTKPIGAFVVDPGSVSEYMSPTESRGYSARNASPVGGVDVRDFTTMDPPPLQGREGIQGFVTGTGLQKWSYVVQPTGVATIIRMRVWARAWKIAPVDDEDPILELALPDPVMVFAKRIQGSLQNTVVSQTGTYALQEITSGALAAGADGFRRSGTRWQYIHLVSSTKPLLIEGASLSSLSDDPLNPDRVVLITPQIDVMAGNGSKLVRVALARAQDSAVTE